MGGIFAQTIVFSAFGVAMSIANDRKNQAVDRFRSLPIANGAVLGGHAVANLLKAFLPIVLMSLTGLVVGWRIHSSAIEAAHGYVLMIAFSFAMIWIGVLLGSLVGTPEGVTGIAFAVLFPITFIASTFVPVVTMPEPLRTVAEWNPTTLAERRAARALRQPQHAGDLRRTRGRSSTRSPTPGSGSSASSSSSPRGRPRLPQEPSPTDRRRLSCPACALGGAGWRGRCA